MRKSPFSLYILGSFFLFLLFEKEPNQKPKEFFWLFLGSCFSFFKTNRKTHVNSGLEKEFIKQKLCTGIWISYRPIRKLETTPYSVTLV